MTAQIIQTIATPQATVCWNAGQGAATFYSPNTNTQDIYIGYNSSISPVAGSTNTIPLQPGQSVTLTAGTGTSLWIVATFSTPLYIIPGSASFAWSNLTINGPVTAEISGPVTVEGTIDIGNTPTVDLAAGATVDIGGTADVNIQNASVDVFGVGGYILPGTTANLYRNAAALNFPASSNTLILNTNIQQYSSLDIAAINLETTTNAAGGPLVAMFLLSFYDSNGVLCNSSVVYASVAINQTADGCNTFASVPCYGSSVEISVFIPGSAGSVTTAIGNVSINGSYRTLSSIKYSGFNGNGPAGVVTSTATWMSGSPGNIENANIASIVNPTLTSGTTYIFPFLGYAGMVSGWIRFNGTVLNAVTVVDLAFVGNQGNISSAVDEDYIIYAQTSTDITANEIYPVSMILPPSPCALVTLPSASGQSFNLTLMGQL